MMEAWGTTCIPSPIDQTNEGRIESLKQFEMAGDYPDVIIGCARGGSNFAGFAFPFVRDKIVDGKKINVVAVEPKACPTLTWDFTNTTLETGPARHSWFGCTP
jgi:predicted alternative tryptophan synthase beta-subunit